MPNPDSRAESIEELVDGMALWQEHKPQTIEDWQAIARRFYEGEVEARAALLTAQAKAEELGKLNRINVENARQDARDWKRALDSALTRAEAAEQQLSALRGALEQAEAALGWIAPWALGPSERERRAEAIVRARTALRDGAESVDKAREKL